MALAVRGTTTGTFADNSYEYTNSAGGWITVSTKSAAVQLGVGKWGVERWQDTALLAPGTYAITGTHEMPVAGIRLMDAEAGAHAVFTGMLYLLGEPQIAGGSEFAGSLSSGGGYTPPGGSGLASGTISWTASPSPPTGTVICDGATYDGTNATYTNLWNAIGLTWGGSGQSAFKVPDLRGRYCYGAWTAGGYPVGTQDGPHPPQPFLTSVAGYVAGPVDGADVTFPVELGFAALLPVISL